MRNLSRILIKELLLYQYHSNNVKRAFNRFDIIVKYLAIENYYGLNNYGFSIYNKMQEKRRENHILLINIEIDYEKKFRDLISSFESNSYIEEHPIEVNRFKEIVDGTHRIALLLYHNVPEVNIVFSLNMYDCRFYYGIEWFLDDFSIQEKQLIINKYNEIFNENLSLNIAILWPPALNYYNFILRELSIYESVIHQIGKDFSNETDFERFINDIYNFDTMSQERIEKKIQSMTNYPKKVKIIYIASEDNLYFKKNVGLTKIYSSVSMNKLKKHIRDSVACRMKDYYFDNIIHFNDSEEDFTQIHDYLAEN